MSEAIKAQAGFLLELKRIDDEGYRLVVGLQQLPAEIAQIDIKIKEHDAQFASARAAVAEVEKKLRESERELKSKEDELTKAEGKMMEVKTNEEYLAVMKENEGRKTAKGELEERVLKLMTGLEEQRLILNGLEGERSNEKNKLLSEKKHLETQKAQLEQDVKAVAAKRETHALQLDAKMQTLYKKLVSDLGRAITTAHNGQCVSCNMKVRPQMYNEIVGFAAIHQCGSCRRILLPPLVAPGVAAQDNSILAR